MATPIKDSSAFDFIYCNVVFPARHPNKADEQEKEKQEALVDFVAHAWNTYTSPEIRQSPLWNHVNKTFGHLKEYYIAGTILEARLQNSFETMDHGDYRVVPIRSQNAALLISKGPEGFLVECYETSPQTDVVMSTDRLSMTFPAKAVLIPTEGFLDGCFQMHLCRFLSQLNVMTVKAMLPQTVKAGFSVAEVRDSTHPDWVTQLLMAILAAEGRLCTPTSVRKHVRDDICYSSSLKPWRRCPLWLIIRVSLQTIFVRADGLRSGHDGYKDFMCHLLSQFLDTAALKSKTSECLHSINLKLGKRVAKLGPSIASSTIAEVLNTLDRSRSLLQQRWSRFQQRNRRIWGLAPEAGSEDIKLKLTKGENYIRSRLQNADSGSSPGQLDTISVQSWMRSTLPSDLLPSKTIFEEASTPPLYALFDFESWVEENLWQWSKNARCDEVLCVHLGDLIRGYFAAGQKSYENDAKQLSTMYLTLSELWCALDQVAIGVIPLIQECDPAIPVRFLQPLLLSSRSAFSRLARVEAYIKSRQGRLSVFDRIGPDTFAVHYFDISSEMQSRKSRIEEDAQNELSSKRLEWQTKSNQYSELLQRADNCVHDHGRHDVQCEKCSAEETVKDMKIENYEWPLKASLNHAKATVFELMCPIAFQAWRRITWMMLTELRPIQNESHHVNKVLCNDYSLSRYREFSEESYGITLASTAKSFNMSHYQYTEFPCIFEDVSVPNGLHYELYDQELEMFTARTLQVPDVKDKCTLALDSTPYAPLQWTLKSTSHFENEVIAKQVSCPSHISLHEFYAFGALRSGERVQWINILRELKSSNLHWNAMAVSTLIEQTIWEAGSPGVQSELRASQDIFINSDFGTKLLDAVAVKLLSVEANWNELHCVEALAAIVSQARNFTQDQDLRQRAQSLLAEIREILVCWIGRLLMHLQDLSDAEKIRQCQDRLCHACICCRTTFDPADALHGSHVFADTSSVAIFVECSILIQDNLPAVPPARFQDLLRRNERLVLRQLSTLQDLVTSNCSGYLQGISKIWKGADNTTPWTFVDSNKLWIKCLTNNNEHGHQQTIHYNLFDGTLLVNGKRLGHLPRTMVEHPIYQDLFGSRILNVVPSNIRGLSYQTTRQFSGHTIHFGSFEEDLIVRATSFDEDLELINRKYFDGELPQPLVSDFVHWLDLRQSQVYIRSRKEPWQSESKICQIDFATTIVTARIGNRYLIDYDQPIARYLSSIFEVLEHPMNTLITRSTEALVEIELTRLRLHFFVRPDKIIQCREVKAVVDNDQELGTLIGLKNRLVLRGIHDKTSRLNRSVVIPYGKIEVNQHHEHVQVMITLPTSPFVHYMTLTVDDTLKSLRPPAAPQARFYHAMLQALCSGVLVDPLTCRTGVEEALSCLQAATAFECAPFNNETASILQKIAKISPERRFYPPHLQVMEVTSWRSDLPWTTQSDEFALAVRSIIDYNNQFRSLYSHADLIELDHKSEPSLLHRALNRTGPLPSGTSTHDRDLSTKQRSFVSRDRVPTASDLSQSQAAFEIARLLKAWGNGNEVVTDLYTQFSEWREISGFGQAFCPPDLDALATTKINELWGALYNTCYTSTGIEQRWKLSFLFAPVAFGQPHLLPHLRTLLEFAFRPVCPGLFEIPKGNYAVYEGCELNVLRLRTIVGVHRVQFRSSRRGEPRSSYRQLRAQHEQSTRKHCDQLAALALQSWPCSRITRPHCVNPELVGVSYVESINRHLDVLNRNLKLYHACLTIQEIIGCRYRGVAVGGVGPTLPELVIPSIGGDAHDAYRQMELRRVMTSHPCCPSSQVPPSIRHESRELSNSNVCPELGDMIRLHTQRGGKTRQKYGHELEMSLRALQGSTDGVPFEGFPAILQLDQERLRHKEAVDNLTNSIVESLRPRDSTEKAIHIAGLWPRTDTRSLLREISHHRYHQLDPVWRSRIVDFGQAITMQQRATRLLKFAEAGNQVFYSRELTNHGYESWSPDQYPDWLLMQIEHNFLIRPLQISVAKHMIDPDTPTSAVMQLNMGEGKSAVIIPMVAAALANGHRLVRVVVLKSLFNQMNRVLSDRLGGLIGRKILSIPFNRQTSMSSEAVRQLFRMYKDSERLGDILLFQPEHILSFKLMSLDRLHDGQLEIARQMLDLSSWLAQHCRDLLDESDELLSPNFELVYTIGGQRLVSGHPDRWIITQRVLSLVEKNIDQVQKRYPSGVELIPRSKGAFPSTRLFNVPVASYLISRIVSDIEGGLLPELSFEHCPSGVKEAVLNFIERKEVDPDDVQTVLNTFDNSTSLNIILVLRGLIGHGIIYFALHQKRWMVNYGQDPRRCLMAVPYRAKGVPSTSAEFGHPDCAIVLTCLSFYYSGLSDQQLLQCFDLLFSMADPTSEYHAWQKRLDLPPEMRSLSGVNLDDAKQWSKIIVPGFRTNKVTIDFFLTNVVFPREAREFDFKLTTSGWDLAAQCVTHHATGFSGTNDLRSLNPLSVSPLELPELLKTSALVLRNLLRPENRRLVSPQGLHGRAIETMGLVELSNQQKPEVQVIIDVGAQILDMTNPDVIRYWLSLREAAAAGVYFDDNDCPMVLDRTGVSERLDVSAFSGNLNQCVVFLDEAHTRGIDLDLPDDFRAMITLGPDMTKDRFVQACMRMRKLGQGQSLVTFAPSEVSSSIRKYLGKSKNDGVDISDAIGWLFEQTCLQIDRYYPIWLSKGFSQVHRQMAYDFALSDADNNLERLVNDSSIVEELMGRTKEREARTLAELYNNRSEDLTIHDIVKESEDQIAQKLIEEYNAVRQRNRAQDASVLEEQEREIEFEEENEREIQRPSIAAASKPCIDEDVKYLVRHGKRPTKSSPSCFLNAANVLTNTSAKEVLPQSARFWNLVVTRDFKRVVLLPHNSTTDEYLRPVRWILTTTKSDTTFILSQFEANELLPAIRKSKTVTLHMYAPRVSRQMHSFYDLNALRITGPKVNPQSQPCPAPENLTSLHLFSGALYFDTHLHYRQLCEFLGVTGAGQAVKNGAQVDSDGFVKPEYRGGGWTLAKFSQNPLPLVKAILGMRRKGGSYASTHMGRITTGRVMTEEEFE